MEHIIYAGLAVLLFWALLGLLFFTRDACPHCGSKRLEYYQDFVYCKHCKRDSDYVEL